MNIAKIEQRISALEQEALAASASDPWAQLLPYATVEELEEGLAMMDREDEACEAFFARLMPVLMERQRNETSQAAAVESSTRCLTSC